MNLLVAYGTTEGQTARIAGRIGERLRARGARVAVVDTGSIPDGFDLGEFDGVLVGGSVHAGKYQRSMRRFVVQHLAELRALPTAFFSVCMGIASRNAPDREHATRIAHDFPASLGWSPMRIEVFAGGLPFTRYGVFTRFMMSRISRREMGEVDVRRDYDFTDWGQVDSFADGFVTLLWPGEPAGREPPDLRPT